MQRFHGTTMRNGPATALGRSGFTLTELMTVISVIGVLVTVLIITLSATNNASLATVCLSNQREIVKADIAFSLDNKGRLFHPRTSDDPNSDFDDEALERIWVDDSDPGPATVETMQRSKSYEYLGNIDVYFSPFDGTNRMRSYSLNAFVGVNKGADDHSGYGSGWGATNLGENYVPCATLSRITQPSRTLATIGEIQVVVNEIGDSQDNVHGWLVHPGSPDTFTPEWIDTPPLDWDPGRIHLSYMDGSTYTYKLSDYKTLLEELSQHNQTVASPDYEFFRKIMLPGRLKQ
jgi:prepilin-type N-terminal cleavage/methylation domain-containing protein